VVTCGHEERDCETLRSWVLKGLFCQWMMTLNFGHNVSEWFLFLHWNIHFFNKFEIEGEGVIGKCRFWGIGNWQGHE
jgi:hypothetical protein